MAQWSVLGMFELCQLSVLFVVTRSNWRLSRPRSRRCSDVPTMHSTRWISWVVITPGCSDTRTRNKRYDTCWNWKRRITNWNRWALATGEVYSTVCEIKVCSFHATHSTVERGGSAVECRTRESPGSNPLCYSFEVWLFRSFHDAPVHSAV